MQNNKRYLSLANIRGDFGIGVKQKDNQARILSFGRHFYHKFKKKCISLFYQFFVFITLLSVILDYEICKRAENQLKPVGDIGLIEIPKEDRPKHGQRNLLVQVMSMDSEDQLVLAPLLETGVGPNLSIRFSRRDFVKGNQLIFFTILILLYINNFTMVLTRMHVLRAIINPKYIRYTLRC